MGRAKGVIEAEYRRLCQNHIFQWLPNFTAATFRGNKQHTTQFNRSTNKKQFQSGWSNHFVQKLISKETQNNKKFCFFVVQSSTSIDPRSY